MSLPSHQYQLPLNSNSLLKWAWCFIAPHKWMFFLFTANRFIGSAAFIMIPFFIKNLIDYLNSPDFLIYPNQAYYYLLYIGGVQAFGYFLFLFRNYEGMHRDLIKRELSLFAMEHTTNLPLPWHESQGTGNKMQRIFTGRDAFSSLIKSFFTDGIRLISRSVVIISIIAFTAPPIFIALFLGYIIAYGSFACFSGGKVLTLNDITNQFFENIIGKIYEFASAVFTVKSMGLLLFIKEKAWKAETEQRINIAKLYQYMFRRWFVLNNLGNILFVIIGCFALYSLIHKEIGIGICIMIIWYSNDIWDTLDEFADIQDAYYENKNGFMRLTETLKEPIPQLDFTPQKAFPKDWKKLHFTDLSFTYGEQEALKNINISIQKGEKIALVGRSGAGKSTFVKLLLKQVLPTQGDILFDDISIKNISQKEVVNNMAVVLQDTELFHTSIEENVIMNTKNEKNLAEYLHMSYSDTFVSHLPEKETTLVGERGVKLSGGEKQRVGIARALAKETDIIIFDEATSALDSESERHIQKAMHKILRTKTAIIIAHRLSTIKEVDRILVFEKGAIVECGNFKELIEKDGVFAHLWKLQKLDLV